MIRKFAERVREWLIAPVRDIVEARFETASGGLRSIEGRLADDHAADAELARRVGSIERMTTDISSEIRMATDMQREAALLSAGLVARAMRLTTERLAPDPPPTLAAPIGFEESLDRMRALRPRLFPVWRELYDNGARSYVEERIGSCSHREHRYARLFGAYLDIHAHGRLLDIGCGPHGIPSYLAMRDPRFLSGLEPLEMAREPGFEVRRGFNECLPWAAAQFDAVVSGTSLDHVLSLEVSLAEVRRVLKPGGRYLVWLASIPGAAPFDETADQFEPIDRFHLFHFERNWIEPWFERFFEIEDATVIPQPGFDHVFYCMTPRADARPHDARPQGR